LVSIDARVDAARTSSCLIGNKLSKLGLMRTDGLWGLQQSTVNMGIRAQQ